MCDVHNLDDDIKNKLSQIDSQLNGFKELIERMNNLYRTIQ